MAWQKDTLGETHSNAFQLISSIFTGPKHTPLEIEILPKGTLDLLRDGPCVGIPKPMLLAAMCHILSQRKAGSWDDLHLSAANARKRAIKTVARNNDTPLLARALSDELWLLDSLLTSPLHRHAKSPTLWSHRRWLVRAYLDDVVGLRACDAAGFLEAELRVVCGAGARHPRNYPAWDYARDVTRVVGLGGFGHTSMLRQILHWCLRNPGDTSAWSFLTWLVSRPQVGFDGGGQVVQEVLEAAISLQWTSEAVWGLLRVVLASDLCLSALDREKLMNKLCGLDGAYTTQADAIGPSTQLFLRRVEQSLQWVRQESRRQQESPHRTRYKTSPRRTSTLKDRE